MLEGLLVVNGFLKNKIERFESLYQDLRNVFLDNDILLKEVNNDELLIIINKTNIPKYDFILFWDKDVYLAKHLENLGYRVYNSAKSIELCDDKAKTALFLENSGIKMPKTIIAPFTFTNNPLKQENLKFVDEVIKELHLPLIIKESFGSFGEQVYLASSIEEIKDIILKISPKPFIFQEFIKSSAGRDVRIEVVGGKVLGSVLRESQNGDFRSNVLQGGLMTPFDAEERFYDMALSTVKVLGLDFGGVDIMFGENGEPILCEVNSNVHFRTFERVTGVSLPQVLAEYLKENIKK